MKLHLNIDKMMGDWLIMPYEGRLRCGSGAGAPNS